MMKIGGIERDAINWLHHRAEEDWPSDKIASFLSSDKSVFSQLESKFESLDSSVRLKLVYSFLSLRKKQLLEVSEGGFIFEILQKALNFNDEEWLKITSQILQQILPDNTGKRKRMDENETKESNGTHMEEKQMEEVMEKSLDSKSENDERKLVINDKIFEETVKSVNDYVSSLDHQILFLPLESRYLSKNLYHSPVLDHPHFKLRHKDNSSFKPPLIQKKFSREDSKGRLFNDEHTNILPSQISRQSSRQDLQSSPSHLPSPSASSPLLNNNNSPNPSEESQMAKSSNTLGSLNNSSGGLRVSRGYTQEKKKMVVLDFNEVKELANKKTVNLKKIQEEEERERKKKEKIEEMEKKKQERENLKKERETLKQKKEEEKKAKQEEKEEKKKKREKPDDGLVGLEDGADKKEEGNEPKVKKTKKEKKLKIPEEGGGEGTEEKKEKKQKKEKEPKPPKIAGEKTPKKKKEKDPNSEPTPKKVKPNPTLPPSVPSSNVMFPSPLFPSAVNSGVNVITNPDGKSPFPVSPANSRSTQMLPLPLKTSAIPVKSSPPMSAVRSALTANLHNKINGGMVNNANLPYPTQPPKFSHAPVKIASIPSSTPGQVAQNPHNNHPNVVAPTLMRPTGQPQPTTMDELFGTATNQLTLENRKLIQDFLNGNRENPNPSTGPIRQVLINFDKRTDEEPGFITEQSIIFEINYEAGTWRKLRRKKKEPLSGVPAKISTPPGKTAAQPIKFSTIPQKSTPPIHGSLIKPTSTATPSTGLNTTIPVNPIPPPETSPLENTKS